MLYINMKNIGWTFKTKLFVVQFICRKFSKIKKSSTGKIIDIGSHKIHYELLGHGKQNVFLIPGLLGTARMNWGSQLDTLNRDKFTILSFDPPALGFSSPPEHSQHIDGFYRDAEVIGKLIKALEFTKISLVGWCGGSLHSMIVAQHNPQIIDKVVLLTPNYRFQDEQIKLWESYRDINRWSPRMRDDIVERHGFEFVQNMWNNWLKTLREIEKIDEGYVCRQETENIKCPTLIIGCKNDNYVNPEIGRQLSKIIKHSKYVEFEDGKHYPHMKYVQQFNEILEGFLLN